MSVGTVKSLLTEQDDKTPCEVAYMSWAGFVIGQSTYVGLCFSGAMTFSFMTYSLGTATLIMAMTYAKRLKSPLEIQRLLGFKNQEVPK